MAQGLLISGYLSLVYRFLVLNSIRFKLRFCLVWPVMTHSETLFNYMLLVCCGDENSFCALLVYDTV